MGSMVETEATDSEFVALSTFVPDVQAFLRDLAASGEIHIERRGNEDYVSWVDLEPYSAYGSGPDCA